MVAEAQLADELGLDVYGIGEHHRPDMAASAPEIVLAAIAGQTSSIKLSSAVTVLSSADPVRVFQAFVTLDLVSDGRAELMVGRGSFTESFPLFGYSLGDYDELFAEKLELLLALRDDEEVTWSGRFRAPLEQAVVHPRPERPLPIWVAVGGTPNSVVRAGTLGLPLALAIIGGQPASFLPLGRSLPAGPGVRRARPGDPAGGAQPRIRLRRRGGRPGRVPSGVSGDLRQDRAGAGLAAHVRRGGGGADRP